jgi:hypothetical protein
MKQETKLLIETLYSGSISNDECIELYFPSGKFDENFCLLLLETGLQEQDYDVVEEAVVVLVASGQVSKRFTNVLCNLLLSDWHYKHEDIAMLLKEIRDPETVDCLYRATQMQFEYLDYDDTYQFARKCIKALAAIDNEAGITKLRSLAASETTVIADYAKKELIRKGLV